MKNSLFFLLMFFSQSVLAFQIYSDHAGFFDLIWTKNDFKFLMIELVSILVSIHFLYKTEGAIAPTWKDIIVSVLVNTAFIVITYQWAIDENVSLWIPMIISFILGTFGFVILNVLKDKMPTLSSVFFDDIYKWAKQKMWPSKPE